MQQNPFKVREKDRQKPPPVKAGAAVSVAGQFQSSRLGGSGVALSYSREISFKAVA
jgi:hypothetical protein